MVGLTGLVVKPTAGLVDFLTTTMQGASKSAEFFNKSVIVRVRQPRAIFSDRTLMPFNGREAEGLHTCWSLGGSRSAKMRDYIFHAVIAQRILNKHSVEADKGRQAVVLTTDDVVCYEIDNLLWYAKVRTSFDRKLFCTSRSL